MAEFHRYLHGGDGVWRPVRSSSWTGPEVRAQGLVGPAPAHARLAGVAGYGDHRGNLLAGGIAYAAFFSVFAAVVAGFSVFGLLLANSPLFDDTMDAVNDRLPGLLRHVPSPTA